MEEILLVPVPKTFDRTNTTCALPPSLESELADYTIGAMNPSGVKARIDTGVLKDNQAYRLNVNPQGLTLVAGGKPGLFYGFMTLRQLVRQADQAGRIPCIHIEDRPELQTRGVMLDISRDRVPTMETLKSLINLWAELKINQVQLYTEHTFAYPDHETVWEAASPIDPEEAEQLDRYCSDRAIELVPCQNSFGHMERWLKHARYSHLAEATGSFVDPWGGVRHQATTLNPLDPGSLNLLRDLYDKLLPHFSSNMINVGADEPFELGQGRSREACEQRGVGRVYLEFMLKIHEALSRRGKIMQFYGDIILHHPELIDELPRDIIALNWGYEAEHPFATESRVFARADLRYYVCPGTSAWNTLGGRWRNARQNILSAAREGRSAGASGLLLTDWGDNGHWQQLPVSYPGYLLAAASSWNPDAAADLDIPACLSRHVFRDESGYAARAVITLGNLYDDGIVRLRNAGVLAVLLLLDLQPYHVEQLTRFRGYDFSREQSGIADALSLLENADIRSDDADLLYQELRFTADLMAHAARLGKQRFATSGLTTQEIPVSARRDLAEELESLVERYKQLWPKRSRPGGLADSVARMLALRASYLSE
ncbi:MAG: family 20 glycosylhydrolase [Spirochaetaceae bacterium]|nr:MAG: family 20 glycosylhydrolase [Spirochaetaceae bacterium]